MARGHSGEHDLTTSELEQRMMAESVLGLAHNPQSKNRRFWLCQGDLEAISGLYVF